MSNSILDTYVHVAIGAAAGGLLTYGLKNPRISFKNKERISGGMRKRASRLVLVSASFLVGYATHSFFDWLPHGDYLVNHGIVLSNRYWPIREFIACVAILAILFRFTSGNHRIVVLAAGLGAAIPDLESLAFGVGLLEKTDMPFRLHFLSHGSNLGYLSAALEFGSFITSLGIVVVHESWIKRISEQLTDSEPVPGGKSNSEPV